MVFLLSCGFLSLFNCRSTFLLCCSKIQDKKIIIQTYLTIIFPDSSFPPHYLSLSNSHSFNVLLETTSLILKWRKLVSVWWAALWEVLQIIQQKKKYLSNRDNSYPDTDTAPLSCRWEVDKIMALKLSMSHDKRRRPKTLERQDVNIFF